MNHLQSGNERKCSRKNILIFLIALLIVQPFLDLLSYSLIHWGLSVFPITFLRGILFLAVVIYSLKVDEKGRKTFILFCLALGGFWILHVGITLLTHAATTWKSDLNNYLKFIQLPLFFYAFFRLFRAHKEPELLCVENSRIEKEDILRVGLGACCVNFWVMLFLDFLAWLTHSAEPTYWELQKGFLGWYHLANAVSVLLAVLFPLSLYAILRWPFPENWKKRENLRIFLFVLTSCLGIFRIFYFGTRVSFASMVGTLCLMLGFVLTSRKKNKPRMRKCLVFVLLACLVGVVIAFPHSTLWKIRTADRIYAQNEFQDLQMKDWHPSLEKDNAQEVHKLSPEDRESFRKLYSNYMPDLVRLFPLEKVIAEYGYSTDFLYLRNQRAMKIHFASLRMQESAPALRWTGLNFEQMKVPGKKGSYDFETDVPAVYYYNGYLGTAAFLLWAVSFLALFLYFLYRKTLWGALRSEQVWLLGYILCVFLLASATGGSVFRRPSVSIYLAFWGAYAWEKLYSFRRLNKSSRTNQ